MSAFGLELSTSVFRGWFEPYAEETFDRLLSRGDISVTRLFHRPPEEQVLVIPLVPAPSHPDTLELQVADYSLPIARLIATRLPIVLPELKLEGERMGVFRLKRDDDQIDGTAQDIVSEGASIVGLDVLRIEAVEDASSYLGTVKEQGSETLTILGERGIERIDADSCRVEPSLRSFQRLLRGELGASAFEAYLREERRAYAKVHCGDGYVEHVNVVRDWLTGKGWLEVAPELSFRVGSTIAPSLKGPNPGAVHSRDILYCFSPDRTKTHKFPTFGLEQYGPFDSRKFDKKEPRFWIVYPDGYSREVEEFAAYLFEGFGPAAIASHEVYGGRSIWSGSTSNSPS
ncbi:hypothetical protein [Nannocystis pusilla]|uniref:hypothetical protein n=1 Tax=Nannocystis pusilla TaxID=889268 RepID=UPI003B7F9FDF